ncbi:MAG: MFS transporter [Clostridia bacterium]|nr:MFS transporter [Clostridia bacterium]
MDDLNKQKTIEIAEYGTDEQVERRLGRMTKVDRRVVSRKETIGYMLFDGSAGFNIDGQKELFVDSILQIGFNKQSLYNVFAGIWDVMDDFIIGGIVEKTRTRWGKFVPYFLFCGIPFAVVVSVFWLLPMFFSPEHIADTEFMPKFVAYVVLELLMETVGNFRAVATSGYLSTVTPYPSDRRRLLAVTKYCNLFYAGLPNTIIEFMLDFITNGLIKSTDGRTGADMIRRTLMFFGPFTGIVSGLVLMWYSTIAKERVHQSIKIPRIRDSLRIVFTNKPVLMYMISNALGSFSTGIFTNSYYRWVLFMTTFETFAGIPSVFFQPLGFAKYNKLSDKFSTKTLYMLSQTAPRACYIPVFLYGMLFKMKDGTRFFQNRIPMFPITAVWEIIFATFQGVSYISADEIRNECNDYIEWKTGTRNEATLSVASTVLCKIPQRLNNVITPKLKDWIGFDRNAYPEGRPQTESAQKWIFAMSTLIPAFLALTSILPMFGYRINKATRDRMYAELNERRSAKAEQITESEA